MAATTTDTMRAFSRDRYGPPDAFQLSEIDRPPLADNQVLVRIHAASTNAADWHLLRGVPYIARPSLGLRRPEAPVLGCDLAGLVVEVGEAVTAFGPGDAVYGEVLNERNGSFAEFVAVPEDRLGHKPTNLAYTEAAAVPLAGVTALQALRDAAAVRPGQRVMIIGASGGVGSFAVQLARVLGAEVTAVCRTRNLELARRLGADHVVDYTEQDLATAAAAPFDVVVQAAGADPSSALRRLLTPRGTLVLLSGDGRSRWFGPMGRMVRSQLLSLVVRQKLVIHTVKTNRADLEILRSHIEDGSVSPAIDRTYPFDELPEALRYQEQGHTRGKVVIDLDIG